MAVKKIEELNIHRDVNSTEQFDVQGYLNGNWDKMQDVIDNNAEELMQVQKDINTLKEDNKTNKSSIDVLEKSNETRDGKISKNAEDIEAIQGSIKAATETINKKDNEQDGKITLNKESIKEIQAENERLREDIKSIATIGEASGENIHLEDSSDARCEIEIDGNHQQETREGYNQININDFFEGTRNGVTITKDLEKGSLTFNGTVTSTFAISIPLNLSKGTIISYSLNNSKVNKEVIMRLGIANGQIRGLLCNVVNAKKENFELTEDINEVQIRIGAGITLESFVVFPQLETNTSLHNFEIYGASPSIDYPSPVKSVGNIKNILDMSNAKGGTSGGITCTMNKDGSYTYKGTASSKAINIWLLGSYTDNTSIFRLEPGTYYIDGVVLFDGNNALANPDIVKIFTFINAHDITGVRALDAVSGNTYDETKYPIIAKIDHEIPWIPYDCGFVQVNVQNKNYLANIAQSSVTENGITATYDGKKFLCKGTTTSGYFGVIKKTNIYLPIGTYTFSQNAISRGRFVLRLYYRDNTFSTHYISTATWRVSFTTSKEAVSFGIFCDSLSSGINIDYTVYVQLERGATNTDWIKPEIQQRIFPVQQEMLEGDTFIRQDGKWYEKHCWKKIIVDGENVFVNVVGVAAGRTWARINGGLWDNSKDIYSTSKKIKCTHFRVSDSWENNTMYGKNTSEGMSFQFIFDNNDLKTVNDVNKALKELYESGTPVIIYYLLAEPELIECTEAQSKVLDEIYSKAHTYKNITNISAESSEVNPIVSLKYLKDVETEHNKLQAQIDEIKQLLSTTETSALLVNNLEKDLRMEV